MSADNIIVVTKDFRVLYGFASDDELREVGRGATFAEAAEIAAAYEKQVGYVEYGVNFE